MLEQGHILHIRIDDYKKTPFFQLTFTNFLLVNTQQRGLNNVIIFKCFYNIIY